MIDSGSWTDELRQCRECGWWTRWLGQDDRCRCCQLGWAHCAEHGRLELAGWPTEHIRVAVADVLRATEPASEALA